MTAYPALLEPEELESYLENNEILIIDLCKPETYQQGHVAGALHLDYAQVVAAQPPVMGLLPDETHMSQLLSGVGLTEDTHVVAYDDEGGGRAARLLWSLAAYGHKRYSLLNGGLHAWVAEGHALSRDPVAPRPSDYQARYRGEVVASASDLLTRLGDTHLCLLDTRSPKEYTGEDKRAERAGHIPGAVNFEWTLAMDPDRNLRLKDPDTLRDMLETIGITADKEIVAYCQTHHRSAHTWFMLAWLGFENVKGYPGAWSDWGNRSDTPIEV